MRRLARAAPNDDNVRQAILDLLDHPYDFESVEETPNPFDDGRHAETVVQVLETLNAASTGADDTLDQSLRRALLQAQVRSQQFDAARTTARSILEIDGPESLGLLDFLRHYIEADRADRATHDLLEEALLHDTMAPEIESRIAPSQRALLTLARVKLALLEGDLDEAQLLAASAREWLHGTEPADDPHPDANLAHRLALFEAKVHERRGNWKQAVAAYSEAEDALVENTPERIDLAISLGLARAEIEDTALADDSLLHGAPTDPRDLWQLQIIERGLGDPLLNTTGNPERLRIAVGNLESLLAGSRSSALDAYVLYHMGRSLARAGMEHCAIAHLDRALNALPSDPLRLGILRERAEIHCLVGNAWSQWQTLRAMAPLIESRAARDTLRFRMVAPMLEAGARTAAKNLLIRLRDDAALGSIRAAALEELEILGEIDNAREE